jgi:hypothetical protein
VYEGKRRIGHAGKVLGLRGNVNVILCCAKVVHVCVVFSLEIQLRRDVGRLTYLLDEQGI